MSAQTIARYRTRMWHFCCWLDFIDKLVPETRWELDDALRDFIEDLWATSDPFTWSESTLAAMQHFALNFWGESMAPGARSAPGGAQNFPIAPPLPPIVVRGIAGLAVVQNGDDVVVGIFLAFHCMLRGAEVIELQVGSINLFRETAVLNLGLTKSGLSRWACEQVTVQDARLVIFLSMLIGSRDKRSHTSTFSAVAFAPMLRDSSFFKLRNEGYTFHTIRRGGATHFFRAAANLGATMEHGRWTSVATVRIYITEGLAILAHHSLTPDAWPSDLPACEPPAAHA